MSGRDGVMILSRPISTGAVAAAKSLQSCLTLCNHRQQPTRFRHPWDSPGENTGLGCHFLLQWMKVKSESEVTQWCPTLHDPVDCSLPGSTAHGIFQARVLEWAAIEWPTNGRIISTAEILRKKQWIWVLHQGPQAMSLMPRKGAPRTFEGHQDFLSEDPDAYGK